jgi:hypothetical protein
MRCARTFSNSRAAFLQQQKKTGIYYSMKSEQTDEEDEDSVRFHFASYHHEVYRLLDDLVRWLEHHYLLFFLTIHVHNPAN